MTTSTTPPAVDPRSALRRLFGHQDFRPGQQDVIDAVLSGDDLLAVMPTGAGKSLCYQLPAFLQPGCTVVISPLVALMKDQLDSLPAALRDQAAVFNSLVEREAMDAQLGDLAAGRLKLLYVAPERLRQRPFLHALARAQISRFVVDEAHCISLWGHDFRPDYLFIPAVLELVRRPPLLAMTATATPALLAELRERFGRPLRLMHRGVLRPNLYLGVERVENAEEKHRRLIDLCATERGAGIVYVSSRRNAEAVAAVLRRNGVNARHYHAGLEASERNAVQDAFMRGRVRVIVATVAFGMGVDKPDVRFIVHFNPSRSLEAYAQESGRAGRDGRPARCILFWTASDKAALARWAREDALTPALLNATNRAVRLGTGNGFAWWPVERLVQAVRGAGIEDADETMIRVALGALEQVGVLRRHCDLPETAHLRLLSPDHPTGAALAGAYGLPPGGRLSVPLLELAAALDCPPSEVEEVLLDAQDVRALTYTGFGRGLLLELLPYPADLRERLRALRERDEQAQLARRDAVAAYAMTDACRTATIARHFGVDHASRCGTCDVCLDPGPDVSGRSSAVAPRPPPADPGRAPEDIIIEAIAELPFPMGRTGVARLLKGSVQSPVRADRSRHFGALAGLTTAAIERAIDALVAAGYLHRDDGEYRFLSVTPSGFAKPAAPWPPPRPQAAGRRRERRAAAGRDGPPDDAPAGDEDAALVEARFESLRQWRRERVRETGLPAYTVLNDETLRLLAARRITSLSDLGRVKGIGPAKLERYGAALLELLRGAAD